MAPRHPVQGLPMGAVSGDHEYAEARSRDCKLGDAFTPGFLLAYMRKTSRPLALWALTQIYAGSMCEAPVGPGTARRRTGSTPRPLIVYQGSSGRVACGESISGVVFHMAFIVMLPVSCAISVSNYTHVFLYPSHCISTLALPFVIDMCLKHYIFRSLCLSKNQQSFYLSRSTDMRSVSIRRYMCTYSSYHSWLG